MSSLDDKLLSFVGVGRTRFLVENDGDGWYSVDTLKRWCFPDDISYQLLIPYDNYKELYLDFKSYYSSPREDGI